MISPHPPGTCILVERCTNTTVYLCLEGPDRDGFHHCLYSEDGGAKFGLLWVRFFPTQLYTVLLPPLSPMNSAE